MAALRGWARSSSTASKLATVEQIIGYQFKSVEKLYEALDVNKQTFILPNGEKRTAKRPRNQRLALIGDAAAQLHLTCEWYKKGLNGPQWIRMRNRSLSNNNLGKVGFTLGLDECTVPGITKDNYVMASTVEAILGAVQNDGGEKEVSRVMARLGITHRFFLSPERTWIHEVMPSTRSLPSGFFAGHQWDLQKLLFNINPNLLPRGAKGGVERLPLNEAFLMSEAGEAHLQEEKRAEGESSIKAPKSEARLERNRTRARLFFAQRRAGRKKAASEAKTAEQTSDLEADKQAKEVTKEADATAQPEAHNEAQNERVKRKAKKPKEEVETRSNKERSKEAKRQEARRTAEAATELGSKAAKESTTVADPADSSQDTVLASYETYLEYWRAIKPTPRKRPKSLSQTGVLRELTATRKQVVGIEMQLQQLLNVREKRVREGAPLSKAERNVAEFEARLEAQKALLRHMELRREQKEI